VLKEFWFPFLLFLAGIPLVFVGLHMSGNGRRACFTISAFLVFVAIVSYIWGDPVRGPFAYLTNPKNPEKFVFHAGVTCGYPVKRLKDGIDFTNCIKFGTGIQPIQLWVKKTWWSDLRIKMTLLGPGQKPILRYENGEISYIDPGFDLNHDEYALELVGSSNAPVFQLVIAEDYSAIYANAIISQNVQNTGVWVLKDNRLQGMPIQEANKPENRLDRIFKYPSYAHRGER